MLKCSIPFKLKPSSEELIFSAAKYVEFHVGFVIFKPSQKLSKILSNVESYVDEDVLTEYPLQTVAYLISLIILLEFPIE